MQAWARECADFSSAGASPPLTAAKYSGPSLVAKAELPCAWSKGERVVALHQLGDGPPGSHTLALHLVKLEAVRNLVGGQRFLHERRSARVPIAQVHEAEAARPELGLATWRPRRWESAAQGEEKHV